MQNDRSLSGEKRTTLIVFLFLLLSVCVLTLSMVLPYLLAVVMGGILALLLQPIFRWLRSKGLSSKLAALVVTLGVVLVILGPLSFFFTKVIQQGTMIGQSLTQNGFSFRSVLEKMSKWGPIKALIEDPRALENQARRWFQAAGSGATGTLLGWVANLPNILLRMVLALLGCFFFLTDGRRFVNWMVDKIPLDADVRARVIGSFKDTAVSVIWATFAAALAQCAVMTTGYLVLSVPAAFLAAGATFIFAWIPIVGSTPVWVAAAIYLYTQDSVGKTLLMVAFGLATGVVDNFVRPMVLRGRSNIHPLVSLVAIFGGISTFGLMGVFLGPILAAVMISLLQIWPEVGSRFGLLPQSGPACPKKSQ